MRMFDLFKTLNETSIANYADENTPYVSGDTHEDFIVSLETCSLKTFK